MSSSTVTLPRQASSFAELALEERDRAELGLDDPALDDQDVAGSPPG